MRLALRTLACAASLVFSAALSAQQTLHGKVLDPLGAVVPNTVITLMDPTHPLGLESIDAERKYGVGIVLGSTSSSFDGTYTLVVPHSCPCIVQLASATFPTTTLSIPAAGEADLTLQTPTRTDQVTVTTGMPTPLAQSGAPLTILTSAADFPEALNIEQPLRLIPGIQITQNGQAGAVTSTFLRGGNSDFTKVFVDGVPVNDIGALADLSTLVADGIGRVEVLRQPATVLYGSDVLSGVVSLSTLRGSTPLPLFSYAVDGGNLGTVHQQGSISGAAAHADYAGGVAVLQTGNNLPNDQFHNTTIFSNLGYTPAPKSSLRFTLRRLSTNSGNPNAFLFFGVPDLVNSSNTQLFLSTTGEVQTTRRWHSLARYGYQALNNFRTQYATLGTYSSSAFAYVGLPETIQGGNGYSVTGQAALDFSKSSASTSTTRRAFVYGQTDYRISPAITLLGGFQFESERGASTFSTASRRNYSGTVQLAGNTLSNRLFYVLGSGIEGNDVYGRAVTPRASAALYVFRPNLVNFLSGTKLHGSFGRGIEEPSVGYQVSSLYGILTPAQIAQYSVNPLGGEYSRTFDGGLEQQFGDGRARINLSYFHNQFNNVVEYIPTAGLKTIGVPSAIYTAPGVYGAYVNSLSYRALGGELESEFRLTRSLFARAGYTYLDARVQRSFSSDALNPNNTAFPGISIGNYSPLVGARPFRRAPHSGYFALQYTHSRLNAQISGSLVGRRDDSTFLGGKLALPNRNLDGAYQRLTLSGDFRINSHLTTYANLDNLLNQPYQEAFGFPALPLTVRGGVRLTFGGESFKLR